jgi:hypothetical protein
MTYGVVWSENRGPLYAGSLDLQARFLLLVGRAGFARECRRKVFYAELVSARIERERAVRLGNRPTLVLEDTGGNLVRIASVQGTGALHELLEHLSAARGKPQRESGRARMPRRSPLPTLRT